MPLGPKPNPSLSTERSIRKGLATEPEGLGPTEQDQAAEPVTQRETVPFGTLGRVRWRRKVHAQLQPPHIQRATNRNLTLPLNHSPKQPPIKMDRACCPRPARPLGPYPNPRFCSEVSVLRGPRSAVPWTQTWNRTLTLTLNHALNSGPCKPRHGAFRY